MISETVHYWIIVLISIHIVIADIPLDTAFCSVICCCLVFLSSVPLILLNSKQATKESGDDSSWRCDEKQKCEKITETIKNEKPDGVSWLTCQMLCSNEPPIWPKPKSVHVAYKNATEFSKEHIFLKIFAPTKEAKEMLKETANIFVKNLDDTPYKLLDEDEQIVRLRIHVSNTEVSLTLATKENYTLYIQNFKGEILVNVYAISYFGARHALETVSQLIWLDSTSNRLKILHDLVIKDEPAFPHRGLMIDTSRNFLPVPSLKRAIDGMAFTKLNTLHLHLTDVESFPIILPSHEEFAKGGAYKNNMSYSPNDIKSLINYARIRGIKVILEIDAPSHVNAGWPRDMIMCDKNYFNGLLNPDNPNSFTTLGDIYKDLLNLGTNEEIFHIGGDEVNLNCWRNTISAKEIGDLHDLWINVTKKMLDKLKEAHGQTLPKNVVLWSSPLTDNYLQKLELKENIVVQFWFGAYRHILRNGYKIIFSTVGQWYLDCGFGPWKMHQQQGSCDPYTPWQKFYKYRPWSDVQENIDQVLGGEVCLWSEQVSPDDLETRLWPRTAAFAERMWSDPESFDELDVFKRISFYSKRMRSKGYGVAAIWPAWCTFYPEQCVNN